MIETAENWGRIREVSRIAIIGPSGSGKSTLARILGEKTGLPVYHLDRLYWKPGWRESTREEFRKVQGEVVSREEWIIDGNYSSTFDLRIPRAELIIWLDFPRRIYFRRVVLRVVKNYGRVRPDLAEGCPEKFDREFLEFVWRIPKNSRPRTIAGIEKYEAGRRTIRLGSPREVRRLFREVLKQDSVDHIPITTDIRQSSAST